MKKGKQRNVVKRRQAKKGQTAAARKNAAKSRARAAAIHRQDAPFLDDVPIYVNAPEKLSAAVLAYAQPLIGAAEQNDEIHKAISIAVLIWNLSLLPNTEARAQLQELVDIAVDSADDSLDRDLHAMFEMMYNRKLSLFAEDLRPVLNYEIKVTDNSYHLDVASVVPAI